MATKVLSIEIGQGLTRVVEMDFKAKNPKIYNCFTFETPQDMVDDGLVSCNEAFASILKSECEKREIKTTQVVFSVLSTRIARRGVKIPAVKEKKIQEVVNAGAADFFPIDASQYHLVYEVRDKVEEGDKKQLRLDLLAVPNDLTTSYQALAELCGLTLISLSYAGNSVYQVVKESFAEGVNIVIKLDEKNGMVTVIKDGQLSFQRGITYGIDDAIETVRKNSAFGENLTYAEAIEVLCGKTCIRRVLNPEEGYKEKEDVNQSITDARIEVTESLRFMIGMVGRVLEYYVSHNEDVQIDDVVLIGLGADFSGLSKLMTHELNHKVRVYRNDLNEALSKTASGDSISVSRYASCIGAAMNPTNILSESEKAATKSSTFKKMSTVGAVDKGKIALAAGAIIAVLLMVYSLGGYFMVSRSVSKTEDHIAEMEARGVEEIYIQYVSLSDLVNQLDNIYSTTRSRNEELVAFIEELEQKMPSSLMVINFAATTEGVSMSIETDSKEAAAETLMQLRTFDSIQVVSSAGLTDNLDGDNAVVAFSVDCVYKAVGAEEMEGN